MRLRWRALKQYGQHGMRSAKRGLLSSGKLLLMLAEIKAVANLKIKTKVVVNERN